MNNLCKIGTIEAIAFVLILMITRIVLNIPKEIIQNTGSSAWINVIVISIIVILFTLLICKLFKNFPVCDLIDVSEYLGGKWLKIIVSFIYFLIFIILTAVILRNFSEILKNVIFFNSPIAYILLFFIVGIVVANRLGFPTIARINLIITFLALIAILVSFFFSANSYVPSNLFPIFGYGINETFFSGLINLFSFNGILFLYFLAPLLKDPSKFKKISVIAVVISSIYLFLSVTSLLLLFSFILDSEELISALLASRILSFGNFIQRVDAIFIFTWILAFLSYLSITTFFAIHVFKKATNIERVNTISYCFAAIIFGLALAAKDLLPDAYIGTTFSQISVLVTTFVIPISILALANIKYKKKNKLLLKEE